MRNLRGGTGQKKHSPSRGHNMNKEGRWQAVLVTFEGEEGPRGSWLLFPSWMIEPDVPGSFLPMGLMPKTWWIDSSFPWGCSLHDLWQILDCHLLGSGVEQLVALEHSCHGHYLPTHSLRSSSNYAPLLEVSRSPTGCIPLNIFSIECLQDFMLFLLLTRRRAPWS